MLKKIIRKTHFSRLLTITVTLAIACLAVSTAILTSAQTDLKMSRYFVDQGKQIAETLANQSRLAILYPSRENVREPFDSTLAYPGVVQVRITDLAGNIVADKVKSGEADPALPMSFEAAITESKLIAETEEYWAFVAPIKQEDHRDEDDPFELQRHHAPLLGYAYVTVAKNTLMRLVISLVVGNTVITLSIAAVMIVAIRALMRQMSRPLNALSNLMSRSRTNSEFVRANIDGPRDVIEMAEAYNALMDTLNERDTELRQSRDAALKTAMLKSQFAAMVGHEVRTPLNGIIGMLEMARLQDLPRKLREFIDIAWQSAKTLNTFTNDVLDFSKLEAGKLQLEEREFDLHELIEEVLNLFSKQAQKKGIELAYSISPSVPDRIRADELRLRQVLNNLVSNAVKFTNDGNVSVKVAGKIRPNGEYELSFSISDTGIGIPEADQKSIFHPYTQAKHGTSRSFGGTGLGLALCQQLVTLMHGAIGVSSAVGKGSVFWFTIRCTEATQLTGSANIKRFTGKRALVVEDNEVVREFLAASLTRLAIDHIAVSAGDTALQELRRADRTLQVYDLVIMNSGATDGMGADLERRIRQENLSRLPSLLLLDLYAAPFSTSAYENSIVLGKPLSQARVAAAIEQLFDPSAHPDRIETESDVTKANRPTVLVVEDNRPNQMVVEAMLSLEGYEVRFANNGEEAVDMCRHCSFVMILMDCLMPVMDGYEATAHIRANEADSGKRTPIVALTANNEQGQSERCNAAGMDDFLTKPVSLSELRDKLQRWAPIRQQVYYDDSTAVPFPAEKAEDGPLDIAVYTRLREMMGPNFPLMCQHFLEDMGKYVDQLDDAIQRRQTEDITSAAHAIRGSAGNLGAIHLVRIARLVEEDLVGEADADLSSHVLAMRDSLAVLRKVLPQTMTIASPPAGLAPRQVPRILVVDDDRSTRTAIRFELQQDGFEIDEAPNGVAALTYLQDHRPDAILMDALMPEMDGFTTCAKITQMPGAREIPVLMITSLDDRPSIERAFAAGACDYLTKPIHFAVLSQRVRRIIRGSHAERRVRDLVTHDPLTHLPNRAIFFQTLEEFIAAASDPKRPLSVFVLNVDRFKTINDTWGHAKADKVLQEIAMRIGTEGFDYVARLGGDEFGMIRKDSSDPTAIAAATQRLCSLLSAPFKIEDFDLHVDASIGVAMFPSDAQTPSNLIKCADAAMQKAKRQRSGFQFYNVGMGALVSDSTRTEHDLQTALQRGQLRINYQPQVDLASGRVTSVEALLRWHHPLRGIVLPAEFIPEAEESGVILSIADWVLNTVCKQMVKWRKTGTDIARVAINISRMQVLHPSFLSNFTEILAVTGCDPRWIELELTEDLFHEEPRVSLDVLVALQDMGVRLCVDDYGTSSRPLTYLKDWPITTIKIDRSFVQDLPPEDAGDLEIVSHIVNLAHAMQIDVVAEGVETEFQERFLRDLSCNVMQGFRFSQAVPADELPTALKIIASTLITQ